MSENGNQPSVRLVSAFNWNEQTTAAAIALAEGKTQQEVATEVEVSDRTIRRWLQDTDFAAEVDRLSLMTGIASRAERLRLAKRVIKQKIDENGAIKTDRDILEWVKFAQSETDGIKLALTQLAALGEVDPLVAAGGQDRESQGETIN